MEGKNIILKSNDMFISKRDIKNTSITINIKEENDGISLNMTTKCNDELNPKDGDFITIEFDNGPEIEKSIVILKGKIRKRINVDEFDFYAGLNVQDHLYLNNVFHCYYGNIRYSTKEEKEHLLNKLSKIDKVWNPETKCIENINTFKHGDIVYLHNRIIIIDSLPDEYICLLYPSISNTPLFDGIYAYDFDEKTRYATSEEKEILFKALEKVGKRWNTEKLCIEDISQNKFKPGDKIKVTGFVFESEDCIHNGIVSFAHIGEIYTVSGYDKYIFITVKEAKFYIPQQNAKIIKELKINDLVIAWDDSNNKIIGKLEMIDNLYNYFVGRKWYKYSIKWDGTKEQFDNI